MTETDKEIAKDALLGIAIGAVASLTVLGGVAYIIYIAKEYLR